MRFAVATATGRESTIHLLDVSEASAPATLGEVALPAGLEEILRLGSSGEARQLLLDRERQGLELTKEHVR